MNRDHELLDLDDLYIELTQTLQMSLFSTKKQILELKDFINKEKQELQRNPPDQNNETLEAKEKFFDHVLREVGQIEHVCENYHTHLKSDVAEEIYERLIPPSHTSLSKVKKAFEKFNRRINFEEEESRLYSIRGKEWRNVSKSQLDFPGDSLTKGKIMMPSVFDDSDLKFKQEMVSLRMKLFKMPPNFREQSEVLTDAGKTSKYSISKTDFVERIRKTDTFVFPSIEDEISKIETLKFIKGKPKIPEGWRKLLEAQGNQLISKWYLLFSPQLEKILMKRRVPLVWLHPLKTLNFLLNIPENGINFILNRKDLLPLLENKKEAWPWINKWKLQFENISGHEVAATLIQTCWRGYWVRKMINESECKYVAASVIWHGWEVLKTKRQMHEQYLLKLETSLVEARHLSLKLSTDYDNLTKKPHVVIHLPSLGFLRDIRRTFPARNFPYYQNTMDLKFSHLRNPNAEVIYVLPVKVKQKLVEKYYELIDSIHPKREDIKNRLIFVELPQTRLFQTGSFNVSRSLYFSEQSFRAVKEKLEGKPGFFLPWVMDECDMILSDHYKIPLLAPSLDYQKNLRNKSYFLDMVNSLGLNQPPYETYIKDYETLCNKLAEFICLHTEVCSWMIKLNIGSLKHISVFLVNHLSVPFMPILRRERNHYSEENWKTSPELREDYLDSLKKHLPEVVSKTTRLAPFYKDWKDFEAHLVKYGVVIQATVKNKSSNILTVSLFIPGKASGKKPRWTGTADKYSLDLNYDCLIYMIPENSIEIHEIEPTVSMLSETLQDNGYFGYVAFDFHCYRRHQDDKIEVMVIDIHPYYGHAQHFIDWVKFAVSGSYNKAENTIDSNVITLSGNSGRNTLFENDTSLESPNWNAAMERYAIGIAPLRHSALSFYPWSKLKTLAEECDINFNPAAKEGSHLIPITGDHNKRVLFTSIGSAMKPTIAKVEKQLQSLQKILSRTAKKKKKTVETNIKQLLNFIAKMHFDYENVTLDKCATEYNPL